MTTIDTLVSVDCMPGLMLAWHEWMDTTERDRPMPYPYIDTRIPAHRDFISRVLAEDVTAGRLLSLGSETVARQDPAPGVWRLA